MLGDSRKLDTMRTRWAKIPETEELQKSDLIICNHFCLYSNFWNRGRKLKMHPLSISAGVQNKIAKLWTDFEGGLKNIASCLIDTLAIF